jgi:hypothetical protein
MAGALQVVISATLTNGSHREIFNPGALAVVQDAVGVHAPVQTVGTSEEAVPVGDVGTLGWAFFQNLDTTNYVTIGPDATGMVPFIRLEAGEACALRLSPGISLVAQANTAPVKMKVLILED